MFRAIGVELFNIPNLTFHLQLVYFIFVGSENNSLYLYYKGLSKQLLTFKFDTVRSVLVRSQIIFLSWKIIKHVTAGLFIEVDFVFQEREKKDEEANEFVSAVSWRTVSRFLQYGGQMLKAWLALTLG